MLSMWSAGSSCEPPFSPPNNSSSLQGQKYMFHDTSNLEYTKGQLRFPEYIFRITCSTVIKRETQSIL